MVAAAVGIGTTVAGVTGSALNASAASAASKQEQEQDQVAQQNQVNALNFENLELSPYQQAGASDIPNLQALLNSYGSTVTPYVNALTSLGNSATAQQALAQTPGYQFTLNQGLQATQNSNAAQGLGISGAALKGAAQYATGLANNTYQQQYNNALTNLQAVSGNWQNQWNANNSLVNLGQNSAANTATNTQNATNSLSSLIQALGNAQAAGTVGTANALGGIGNSIANGLGTYNGILTSNALTANMGGGSGGVPAAPWDDSTQGPI